MLYHGRALVDVDLLKNCGLRAESIIHVSVSAMPARRQARNVVQPQQRAIVPQRRADDANQGGNDESSEEEEEENIQGFDRLREMGFSADDVRQFRLQFYLHQFRNAPAGHPQTLPQTAEMIRLENQWIDTQFNAQQQGTNAAAQAQATIFAPADANIGPLPNNVRRQFNSGIALAENLVHLGSVDGNGFNLMTGLIVGFLLGLISLFWIGEPYLTRKTRFGMALGIIANLFIGLLAIR